MRRVAPNRLAEVTPQGAWRGFRWIGRPHGVAPLANGIGSLQSQQHTGSGRHEVGQLTKKRPLTMDRVKAFSFLLAQVLQPHRPDGEASLVDPRQDLPGKLTFNRVRLDDRERS